MLLQRLISALLGILLLLFFILVGSLPFAVFILLIAIIAVVEYGNLLAINDRQNIIILSFFSIITILSTYLTNTGLLTQPLDFLLYAIILLFLLYHLFFVELNLMVQRLSYNLLGLVYLAGGLSFIILLRDFNTEPFSNTKALWLVLLATWASDTGAYFFGSYLGRNKLIERISPRKTVEGAVGGILLTMITVSFYTLWLGVFSYYWFFYAVLISVTAMIGDLFESSLKRNAGLKDSGSILPGHGGVLDRIDSLLFTAPFTYYFLILIS